MESFFSRYRNVLVLFAVLLVQVLALAVQVRRTIPGQPDLGSVRLIRYWAVSLVSPPERAAHGTGRGVRGWWANYIDLIHTRQQNQALQAEIDRLQIEQSSLAEDALQGIRLQQLLGFREHYIYKTVPAQVIGTSGTDQSHILFLDKGSRDGIEPDMPVITPDGIVGKTRDVFAHTSQVLEISDSSSGAGVVLETTRLRGILRGSALGQPQVVNVMPDERIQPGEKVVTSGGDQIFPRGLPVGTVERMVNDPEHDPMQDILIRPAANLGSLEEVLIITNAGDQMPKREQKDLDQAELDNMQQKTSDILAERLPGLAAAGGAKDQSPDSINLMQVAPPLAAIHPDRYTPNATPPAADMTPGTRSSGDAPITESAPAVSPAPVRKRPQIMPPDGSQPPRTMVKRPPAAAPGGGAAVKPRTSSHAAPVNKPASPATGAPPKRRKGPEIVPPDGSQPPPSMHKTIPPSSVRPVQPQGEK